MARPERTGVQREKLAQPLDINRAVTEQDERDQRAEEERDYGAMQELREALCGSVG
jgi:hypothetical protein